RTGATKLFEPSGGYRRGARNCVRACRLIPGPAMNLAPPARIMIEPLVRAALLEDLGHAGDITTDAIVPAGLRARAVLRAGGKGMVAWLDLAKLGFELIDPEIAVEITIGDGALVAPGSVIAAIKGPARGILAAERTALNFLCRLSGIASATAALVAAV